MGSRSAGLDLARIDHLGPLHQAMGGRRKRNRVGTLLLADGNEELNERVIVFRGVGEVSESF